MAEATAIAETRNEREAIYQTGWPRRWGSVRMLGYGAWSVAFLMSIWLGPAGGVTQPPALTALLVVASIAVSFLLVTSMSDMVTVSPRAVGRRSYLSSLRHRGFSSVELAPGSRLVRSKYFATTLLEVGPDLVSEPAAFLAPGLWFTDDVKPFLNALTAAGVEIEDQRGEWLRRRPVLARLEIVLGVVFWASLPVQALLSRGQTFLVAAFSLMLLVELAVVHRMAR